MRKYEPRDDVGPAVETPEVREEMPITTDREESISPESHQGEGEPEPEPDNGDTGVSSTHDNGEYRTRSGWVSVNPTRFNDFVMD